MRTGFSIRGIGDLRTSVPFVSRSVVRGALSRIPGVRSTRSFPFDGTTLGMLVSGGLCVLIFWFRNLSSRGSPIFLSPAPMRVGFVSAPITSFLAMMPGVRTTGTSVLPGSSGGDSLITGLVSRMRLEISGGAVSNLPLPEPNVPPSAVMTAVDGNLCIGGVPSLLPRSPFILSVSLRFRSLGSES